jgi:putative FmdB family regulatory protein
MEALQKISDSPLCECPACHEPALKKQLSAAGFRLSGSGWYETDFKKGNRKNLAGEKTCEGKGSKSCEASGSCPSA